MNLEYMILYAPDVDVMVRFYEQAFGLKCKFRHESGEYAEMETGSTVLAFAEEQLAGSHGFSFRASRKNEQPAAFEIGFTVLDIQAAHRHALSAGATERAAPAQMPWGQWVSYLADPLGNTVALGTPVQGQ